MYVCVCVHFAFICVSLLCMHLEAAEDRRRRQISRTGADKWDLILTLRSSVEQPVLITPELLFCPSTVVFEAGSLTKPGAQGFAKAGWRASSRHPPAASSTALGSYMHAFAPGFSHGHQGI